MNVSNSFVSSEFLCESPPSSPKRQSVSCLGVGRGQSARAPNNECPPTPKLRPRPFEREFSCSVFGKNSQNQLEYVKNQKNYIKYQAVSRTFNHSFQRSDGTTCNFTRSAEAFAKGKHSFVYDIKPDQEPLFPGVENQNIVFKRYQEKEVYSAGKLRSFLTNQMTQYNALQEIKFPVAKILNKPEDDMFFLFEKIPGELTNTWRDKTIEMLETSESQEDQISLNRLTQIQTMFKIARANLLDLDLKIDNVRITLDNRVILIDLMEQPDNPNDLSSKQANLQNLQSNFVRRIETFALYKVHREDAKALQVRNESIFKFLSS